MKISEKDRKFIIAIVIDRLYNKGKFDNKGHTPIENLKKGFPGHLKGFVGDVIDTMIKEGLLIARKHNYGIGILLNSNKLSEIEKILIESNLL